MTKLSQLQSNVKIDCKERKVSLRTGVRVGAGKGPIADLKNRNGCALGAMLEQ